MLRQKVYNKYQVNGTWDAAASKVRPRKIHETRLTKWVYLLPEFLDLKKMLGKAI